MQNVLYARFWKDKWKRSKSFMEVLPNLYRIVRKKCVKVENILNSFPLNIPFRRYLTRDNLVSWLELVSEFFVF
jgi:hypothetical protein